MKTPLVFQIVGARQVNAAPGTDSKNRYRLLISDGALIQPFAMLATELNVLYESNQLEDHTIIQINRYSNSIVNRNSGNEKSGEITIVFKNSNWIFKLFL